MVLSSYEAKYVAVSVGACEAAWLQKLLKEIQLKVNELLKMYVDNASAISLAKNPVAHRRSKHIETRFHFLRDQVEKKKIEVLHYKIENHIVDILTKPSMCDRFMKLRVMLGMVSLENLD